MWETGRRVGCSVCTVDYMTVIIYSAFTAVTCDVSWSENLVSAMEQSDAALYGDWQSDSVVSCFVRQR